MILKILFAFLGLLLSVVILGVVWIFATFAEWLPLPMQFFAGISLILVALITLVMVFFSIRRTFRDRSEGRTGHLVVAVLAGGIPFSAALFGAVSVLAGASALLLPAQSTEVANLTAEGVIVLHTPDGLVGFDTAASQVSAWQPDSTEIPPEDNSDEVLVNQYQLISREGQSYELEFADRTHVFDIGLSRDAKQIAFHRRYSEDDSQDGLWIRDVSNGSQAVRFSSSGGPFAWEATDQLWVGVGRQLFLSNQPDSGTVLGEVDEDLFLQEIVRSPDGKHLALLAAPGYRKPGGEIFVIDRQELLDIANESPDSLPVPLTATYSAELDQRLRNLQWSPDSRFVAFISQGGASGDVATLGVVDAATGESGRIMKLEDGSLITPVGVGAFTWSPDGEQLAFAGALRGATYLANEGGTTHSRFDLYTVDRDGSRLTRRTRLTQESRASYGWPRIWWW